MGGFADAWRALSRGERLAFGFAWVWLLVAMGLFAGFTYDDVFISLRYAGHVASGQGYVFNPGERVEGASNPLWVLLLAGALKLGLSPLGVAKGLGMILVLAIPWLQLLASSGLPPHRPNVVAVWLTALAAPVAFWGVDGLETGAEAFLLTLGIVLAARDLARPGGVGFSAAPVYLAVSLLRPEGALFGAAYLVLLILGSRRDSRRPGGVLAAALILASGVAALLAWRWTTFGSLVPNTYWAKAANAPLWSVGSGAGYLAGFLAEWGGGILPLAAALALLAPAASGRNLAWACGGTVLCQSAFIVSVGRDWMFAWRFIVPAWPALALLAAAGMLMAWEGFRVRLPEARARAALAMLAAGAVAFAGWRLAGLHRTFGPEVHGDRAAHRDLGRWLRTSVPPGTWIALSDCGEIPFESGLSSIDLLGLTDPFIARHTPAESAEYVLGRAPEVVILAQKDKVVAPGAVMHASLFAVDRMLAAHPGFSSRYLHVQTWRFAREYDLALYFRKDFCARWTAGGGGAPADAGTPGKR